MECLIAMLHYNDCSARGVCALEISSFCAVSDTYQCSYLSPSLLGDKYRTLYFYSSVSEYYMRRYRIAGNFVWANFCIFCMNALYAKIKLQKFEFYDIKTMCEP